MAELQDRIMTPTTFFKLVKVIKGRFKSLNNAIITVQKQTEPLSIIQRKTLSKHLIEVKNKFNSFEHHFNTVLAYEGDEPCDEDKLIAEQDEINDTYTFLCSTLELLIGTEEQDHNSQASSVNGTLQDDTSCLVRLPKLELIKFNGDFSQWMTFINLFNTTIHDNKTLGKTLKFQYLLSVLLDEPLNLVRNLSITDANYDVAYQLLVDRYQNDRRLQLLHINRIIDLPDISSKNINGMRSFFNTYNENIQALNAIHCDIADSKCLLAALLLRKLDVQLCKRLESTRNNIRKLDHTLPTVDEIISFIHQECSNHEDAISSLETRVNDLHISKSSSNHSRIRNDKGLKQMVASSSTIAQASCVVCGTNEHKLFACPKLLAQDPYERYQTIKNHQRCISCLGTHNVKHCTSRSLCKHCNKKHNSLLHFTNNDHTIKNQPMTYHGKPTTQTIVSSRSGLSNSATKTVTLPAQQCGAVSHNAKLVLLATALIQIQSCTGATQTFRALIDSGSMCSLISERAVALLNSPRQSCNIKISGISQHISHNKGQILGKIQTLTSETIIDDHSMVILDRLTINLPRLPVSQEVVQRVQQFQLADPTFHIPNRIDVILGASVFPLIMSGTTTPLGPNMPYLIRTPFGQVIMGTTSCSSVSNSSQLSNNSSTLNVCCHTLPADDLHMSIQRFWKQEDIPEHQVKSDYDNQCEQLFINTHSRDETGRYTVRLPTRTTEISLGQSRPVAEQRLRAMERKFTKQPQFASLYRDFMQEYSDLHHMSEFPEPLTDQPHYYLPHHGVLKESSSTTKLRTVFDASCKSSSGLSLNDILMTGQKLQSNIADILLQFRRHNIVICCDIKQMYRQILIHPDDRSLQLIVWRTHEDQHIKTFQLNTVTYGLNSSPYLAIRTLQQLALDEGQLFPDAAYVLQHNTYVDDIITGAESLSAATNLAQQLHDLLLRGGFELRKWVSNSSTLLQHIPEHHRESPTFLDNTTDPYFAVLGLYWSPTNDVFTYTTQFNHESSKLTKRIVLSAIARIYDPCGFLTPFIMRAKCFMQLLWTLGLSWDAPLPEQVTKQWAVIISDTSYLSKINIPRSLNLTKDSTIELHGFCDASEHGYAAVIYFKCTNEQHVSTVRLVIAKSRVAPLNKITIPRLELNAAHLLAKLTSHVLHVFSDMFPVTSLFLWSDSTIVLNWIHTPSYRLKTFVANRVAQIQEYTPPERWNHVMSQDNPADCASRGYSLSQLIGHRLWWNGPSWLLLPSSKWPSQEFTRIHDDQLDELKSEPLSIFLSSSKEELPLLTKYSSWFTLVRITAFILRFIHNCRNKNRLSGFLTTNELDQARFKIVFAVQQGTFNKEFQDLRKNMCPSNLRSLTPFIDGQGLIRVGGRLRKSSLAYDIKHPILLPKDHHVVRVLISHYHLLYLHAGPQFIQAVLSQQYWIINARNVIRNQLHKCVICRRHNPSTIEPIMADLPKVRITPAKPFISTGVDYAGPFSCKIINLRFHKIIKIYIALFVCMVTKAVHIEVVTDLTTDAFIAALTRFISRRGLCTNIYSDCGTNFVGANTALQKIIKTTITNCKSQQQIDTVLANQHITFHFNPPAAPHHGGLWERSVRSVKHHLNRVIGNTILTLPEFITLTTQVEAILNSRPLCPMSNDPNDYDVLTPGHFLTGAPLTALPELDVTDRPNNRLKAWQCVKQFNQQIWKRWRQEYLHTLQQRPKWQNVIPNISIGDLVLLKNNASPLSWPRGRISQTFPGSDNVVRVVKIKTQDGSYTRPVTQLCLLPISDDISLKSQGLQGGR